jgi:hypothetical protein
MRPTLTYVFDRFEELIESVLVKIVELMFLICENFNLAGAPTFILGVKQILNELSLL